MSGKIHRNTARRNGCLSRIRHMRGHGIHSPFVYSVIRNAFMERAVLGDGSLYGSLIEKGVRKKAARQLNNLYVFCSAQDNVYSCRDSITALIKPRGSSRRSEICLRSLQKNAGLVIENRFFFVIFDSGRLPGQHFRI